MIRLTEHREALLDLRHRKGWAKYHTPGNLAAAVASEAGELLHLFRWCPPEEPPRDGRVADELADVLIFAIMLAHECGVDLDRAIAEKIERNRERFG